MSSQLPVADIQGKGEVGGGLAAQIHSRLIDGGVVVIHHVEQGLQGRAVLDRTLQGVEVGGSLTYAGGGEDFPIRALLAHALQLHRGRPRPLDEAEPIHRHAGVGGEEVGGLPEWGYGGITVGGGGTVVDQHGVGGRVVAAESDEVPLDVGDGGTARGQMINKGLVLGASILARHGDLKAVLLLIILQLMVQHPAGGAAAHRAVVGVDAAGVSSQTHGVDEVAREEVNGVDQGQDATPAGG